MTEETTLLNFPNEIKETAYERLGLNETDSDKFNFATISKTEGGIDYIEYWLLINAYYDETIERFIKMDGTATSFGIQMQAKGTYPGEQVGYTNNTGVNVWRNPRKADLYKDTTNFDYTDFDNNNHIGAKRRSDNAWIEFGIGAGWVNNLMTDSYGGVTVGGAGIEVDGNNIFPYARLTSSTYNDGTNDYYLLGILENAYHPSGSTWKCDSNEYEAWFFGLKYPKTNGVKDSSNAKFIVMHNDMSSINPNSNGYTLENMNISDWKIILEVSTTNIKGIVDGVLTPLGTGGGGTGTVVDEITDGEMHAVTSNAVYQGMELKQNVADAFSGDYDDLTNKPTIPEEVSDLTDGADVVKKSSTVGLLKNDGTVDTTHYVSDVSGKLDIAQTSHKGKNVVVDSTSGDIAFENKPTIPSKISDLTNDSDFIETSSTSGLVKNDGTIDTNTYSQSGHTHLMNDITDLSLPAAVKVVTVLPTASADTMDKLFILVGNDTVDVYYTTKSGSNYSWNKMDDDILDNLSIEWSDIDDKPLVFPPDTHSHVIGDLPTANTITDGDTTHIASVDVIYDYIDEIIGDADDWLTS